MMTKHKALYWIYDLRKERGREFSSFVNSVDASIQGLEECSKKSKER